MKTIDSICSTKICYGFLITQFVCQIYYGLHHLQSGPRFYKGKRVKLYTQWA